MGGEGKERTRGRKDREGQGGKGKEENKWTRNENKGNTERGNEEGRKGTERHLKRAEERHGKG